MYAVVDSGGKQYRVSEGDAIRVELLQAAEGTNIELDKVLVVSDDEGTKVGRPYVEGAKVTAKVIKHDKAKKVLAFRYKAKKNVRVRKGHRQPYTQLEIQKIEL